MRVKQIIAVLLLLLALFCLSSCSLLVVKGTPAPEPVQEQPQAEVVTLVTNPPQETGE